MKPILFVVGTATAYKIHKPFAEFCVAQKRRVDFVYDREPDALFAHITADAKALGGEAVSLDASIAPGPHQSPWSLFNRPPARAKAFDAVRKSDPTPRMEAFENAIFGRLAAAKVLLKKLKPAVVVVAEDGVAGPLALITAAQQLGIRVAILPYGYGTQRDFEIALEAKTSRGEVERPEGANGEAIRRNAPEWIKQGPFEGALLFPPDYIVALESAGIRVHNPWVVHGGTADRLLAESPQMFDLYCAEGLPQSKLVLTGSPYGDFVREALAQDPAASAAFRQPRKIDSSLTRILVSWPPSYHGERAQHSEFPTYADMTRIVLQRLAQLPNTRVTVSAHPAVAASDRAVIALSGVNVSDDYVLRLIPRHDIYVSYFSSTIRWAVASGKPVLNYDAYKLNLDVYDQAPGVLTTPSIDRLFAAAGDLTAESVFARVAGQQIEVAGRWGLLDAPAMPRILQEIDALAAS
jgi:hypothetical protein